MPAEDLPEGWTPGGSAARAGGGNGGDGRAVPEGLDSWGPLRDFVRDRLPPAVRGARLDPGAHGVLALAVVALLAAVVAIVIAWSSAAHPVGAVTTASGKAASGRAASGKAVVVPGVAVPKLDASVTPSAAVSSAAAPVVVDVAGKVRRPGLVTLAPGARVADAIAAAGGSLPGSSTTGLSLARRVVDGEQLLIGLPQVVATGPDPASATATVSGPVDLNTATVTELDALPGIGPVLAQRVVDWRTSHGAFTSVDQLREVSGLGGKKFDSLAPLVRV